MEITITSTLSEADSDRLFKWADQVFPVEGKAYEWAEPEMHIVARRNGLAVGHLGFGRYKLLGSKNVDVIGVGGVVVKPEFQGLKIPGKMFDALSKTHELGTEFRIKTLFCPHRLIPYYNNYGFQLYSDSVRFLQNGVYTQSDHFVLMVSGEIGLKGEIKIPSRPW